MSFIVIILVLCCRCRCVFFVRFSPVYLRARIEGTRSLKNRYSTIAVNSNSGKIFWHKIHPKKRGRNLENTCNNLFSIEFYHAFIQEY